MNEAKLGYLIIAAAFLIVLLYATQRCSMECSIIKSDFTVEDQQVGKKALEELDEMLKSGDLPPTLTEHELNEVLDDILIAKVPSEDTKEELSYFHAENTRYWPQYYYSFPYNYKYGGAWPPGMYSRLNYWSPGFYTGSGYSYYLRPGIGFKYWPRNRWIRQTQSGKNTYYYLSNRDSYTHDQNNYAELPLKFS